MKSEEVGSVSPEAQSALDQAKEAEKLRVDSQMLLTCMSISDAVGVWRKIMCFFYALGCARRLSVSAVKLNLSQLDAIVQFFLGAHKGWGSRFLSFLYPSSGRMYFFVDMAVDHAKRGTSTQPHELAYALLGRAQVFQMFVRSNRLYDRASVADDVTSALRLKNKVLGEEPRFEAVRHWVSILRRSGELLRFTDPKKAHDCLTEALELGRGEARISPHEIERIVLITLKIEKENEKL